MALEARNVILVNHGSFNPPHRGHVAMMKIAKERLEKDGYRVTGGILAITHGSHIRHKGSRAMKDEVRVQCIDRIAADMGETWLCGDGRGVHYTGAGRMIQGCLKSEFPDLLAFDVRGADLAGKYGVKYDQPKVYVGRAGSVLPAEGKGPTLVCDATDDELATFSSTKVREAMEKRNCPELIKLVGDSTAGFLMELGEEAWQ
mmetsp:Transcript_56327/g.89450  ORF Transcript_56327/g.89450 Transcript_56327/m.89450 type:complete len:202 (-) Transcript_56327:81-686(-)|eukprot:CAMPEP_0169129318 /NCGR_PEP_ID=MMETSP1015-20121227/37062_1 /TAXON_ID=342587 /ORGANISM="Karlodinium micrum, Strain CCMP2283" /LENGTH=201 /DNA_ID=CAMNT_0009193329 /DNA_START=30 /DNA_END=635 /DNA_ORIENTATION=+